MEKDTLTEDLTVVGLVLIMLVMCSVLFTKLYKIEKELNQAKQLVVEYYDHAELAYGMVHSLNNELDNVDNKHKLDRLIKDLSQR